MNLVWIAPFAGAKNDGLLDTFDVGSPAHALLDSFVGFSIYLVIALYKEIFVKLEPDIVAIHHQDKVLIVLCPQVP